MRSVDMFKLRTIWMLAAVIGVLALALALNLSQTRGCISTLRATETGAQVIRNAVSQWQLAENNYRDCPSTAILVRDRQLDSGQSLSDAWGNSYRIDCLDDDVIVTSAGQDETFRSRDDIAWPPKLTPTDLRRSVKRDF